MCSTPEPSLDLELGSISEAVDVFDQKCELENRLEKAEARHSLRVLLKSVKASRMNALVEQNELARRLGEVYLNRKLEENLKVDQLLVEMRRQRHLEEIRQRAHKDVAHVQQVVQRKKLEDYERRITVKLLLERKQMLAESLRKALLVFKKAQAQHCSGEDKDWEELEEEELYTHFEKVLKMEQDQMKKEAYREDHLDAIKLKCAEEVAHAQAVRLEHLFQDEPALVDVLHKVLLEENSVEAEISNSVVKGLTEECVEQVLKEEASLDDTTR